MAGADRIPDDQWRLDDKSIERAEHEPRLAPPTTETAVNLSHERLTRAVYVVTAEHLGWYLIALYALVTRAIALGARPLDATQARDALAALASGAGLHASWVAILQAWIFAAAGATDATSRIVVMLCGLLMVASGFAMRPFIGRAGALAFAALIAISPSVTYFSRGGSTAIASLTFMMIAIAIAQSMRRQPGVIRAAGLGVAIALWLSADPIGYATAAAMIVSLIVVGLGDAVRIDHRRLRLRVWWERRRALVIVCALVAAGLWVFLTTAFLPDLSRQYSNTTCAPHLPGRRLPSAAQFADRSRFWWLTNSFSRFSRLLERSRSSHGGSAPALRRGRWCGRSSAC
jgi:predicted membrane-bound mannosyltransferase